MSVVLGLLLGMGLLLIASPVLWPAGAERKLDGRLARVGLRVRERMVQAGLAEVPPAALAVVCALSASAAAAGTTAAVSVTGIAIGAGVAGGLLPLAAIGWRARARRRAARVAWPDVVDNLVSALRAGLPLTDALAALGRTGPPGIRSAFVAFERDHRATGDVDEALDAVKDRLADPVADRIIETLRMARDVGGTELTTVLRNLAAYLRQDAALRSEVEARQSWVRGAARLGVAAPWVVLVLLATRPEAARAYDSPLGMTLLVIGLAVSVFAYRLMIALGRLPEERRWFG